MHKTNRTAPARGLAMTRLSMALVAALALAACGQDEPAATAPAAGSAPATVAVTPETAVSSKVSGMTPEQLREAASKAYGENRLYAPAEDNALEYYLALRDKQPGDAAVSSALTDLLPMTVIATEQSVARDDFSEAQRLAALIEKADPQHPSLSRLKTSIVAQQQSAAKRAAEQKLTAEQEAKRQAELEQQRIVDQKKQQEAAAKALAAQQASDQKAEQQRLADQQAAEQRAAEQAAQRAAEQRAAEQRAAAARTASAPASSRVELRALSTPAPRYPPAAFRAGTSGEVQVEFTVAPDGSVSDARVVNANPPRVFDREAVNAVKRWRFQPVDAPVTTRRSISFNPGNG